MSVPCKASCLHQRNGLCELEDERVRGNDVELGEEFDPASSCECFAPVKEEKGFSQKKRKK